MLFGNGRAVFIEQAAETIEAQCERVVETITWVMLTPGYHTAQVRTSHPRPDGYGEVNNHWCALYDIVVSGQSSQGAAASFGISRILADKKSRRANREIF